MKNMDENNLQALSTIAAMYYLDGISQDEIARRFYTSRSTVSRMLKRAREQGIVDIRVNFCAEHNEYYEEKLQKLFHIKAVIVNSEIAQETAGDSTEVRVRKALAEWMKENIHSGDLIGVTRGSIFHDITAYLGEPTVQKVSFVQLMGMEARTAGRHYARDVVTRLSKFYGGKPYYLDAPLVFDDQEAREHLFKVPTIAETLDATRKASLLMTTIPRLEANQETHIWQGFIDREQFSSVIKAKVVGAMFGRAFDINGQFPDLDLNSSIVSVNMDVIKTRKILAVSYGKEFAQAVLGALRSGYINYLVSDSDCIKEVIHLAEI